MNKSSLLNDNHQFLIKILSRSKRKEGTGGGVGGAVWNTLKTANPRDYEKISFNFGICDLRGMLKRLQNTKKNNKKGNSELLYLFNIEILRGVGRANCCNFSVFLPTF